MEKLTCQNCGAPLTKSGECKYCGTIHQLANNCDGLPYIVEFSNPRVQTIAAQVSISNYVRESHPDLAADFSLGKLREELAKGLAGFMRIDTREDPIMQTTIIRGTVRVVPPDFRF